jgi:hypothetical protein
MKVLIDIDKYSRCLIGGPFEVGRRRLASLENQLGCKIDFHSKNSSPNLTLIKNDKSFQSTFEKDGLNFYVNVPDDFQ